MDYVMYVADCETTGLDSHLHDVIELSLLRLNDGQQKTWCLKPFYPERAEAAALRINGHKIEDLRHETKEGRERYRDPNQVIIEVENWMMDDGVPANQRILIGQNIGFDHERFEQLWIKCNSKDSFPFGRRFMDTMVWAVMMDYVHGQMSDNYSLAGISKKYGIKNTAAHTAAADVVTAAEVFKAQVAEMRQKLGLKVE